MPRLWHLNANCLGCFQTLSDVIQTFPDMVQTVTDVLIKNTSGKIGPSVTLAKPKQTCTVCGFGMPIV